MSDLLKLSDVLISECRRLEPCLAEVCADDVSETKVTYENTDFSVASSSTSTILGLRVISKNRLGFVTTNSLDANDLREKAREAQMIARLSPESPFHDLVPAQKISGAFELFDEKLAQASPKEILAWAELLVDECRKEPHVTLDRIEVNVQTSTRLIQNSNGVLQRVKQTTCGWFVMGMAKNGEEVTSFDYEGDSTTSLSEIETRIKKTAQDFRDSVVGSLGAKSAKSYKGPVLFHPAAVGSLIAGLVGFNVNARSQQDGMSKWAKMLGEDVASSLLTISEHPQDETRPGDWTPFDREGVITANHDIIKQGKLLFTAQNAFTAKRGKVPLTGNAVGGSRSLPSIGLHALTVGTGDASQDALYAGLNQGLVLKRFSGNSDPTSGQFSGIAKNSWWAENGKRAGPLKEVMIAGNMFELLQNIKMVGAQSMRQMGSFDSPYILIDGLSVTSS